MSSSQGVSFEERREMMRKVEHMVAEAEALNKTRDLRQEEVHVSDASSSEGEDEGEREFLDIPHVSPFFNTSIDKSSIHSRILGVDVTPRFGNRRKISSRMALTDEIELEALNAYRSSPQDKPPIKSVLSKAKLDTSIASSDKSVTSTTSTTNNTNVSLNSYRGGPVDSVCSAAKPDHYTKSPNKSAMVRSVLSKAKLDGSIASSDKSMTSTPSTTYNSYRGAPLDFVCSTVKPDHSLTSSKKSTMTTPHNIKITSTPLNLHKGASINSVCSTVKPDHSSIPSGSKSVASKVSSTNSNATPLSSYQGIPINSPINSPPFFFESSALATPESISSVQTSSRKKFHDIKKEIDNLTTQFETMDKDKKEWDIKSSCKKTYYANAEKAFEEGLDIMERKTDLMIDALHKSLSNSRVLGRDSVNLRSRSRIMGKEKASKSPPVIPFENTGDVRIENQASLLAPKQTVDHMDPSNEYVKRRYPTAFENTGDVRIENQASLLAPKQTVDHMDSSNEYVKRRYPTVRVTPGTLFVSEFSEVLNLGVGDHTYLSKIMDRQWGLSPDYVQS